MSEKLSQFANYELGEAFFKITNAMLFQDGIPNSKMGDFDLVSPSWRKLADKPDKSQAEIEKVDKDYKMEIRDLADSCILYMSAKIGKKDFIFNFQEYKKFLDTFNNQLLATDKISLEKYNKEIIIQYKKLANHGEANGDNVIDSKDIASYIYALDLKSKYDENNKFAGYYLNGKITPLDFAVAYKHLREDNDNLFTLKLRHAYNNLFGN